MGVPSWMVRRFPRGGRGCDDEVKLDPKKGFVDNLREVLNNVCKRQGISEDKRIAYLNSFIRLINPGNQEIGISRDDFFHCLRPLLIHESVRIRATALNLVRHFLRTRQDLASCVKLQYPYLIARSLDVKVQTDTERVQAVCVARRMLTLDAQQFPTAVARALVAVATSTIDEKDRLLRASLAALVELCLLNPDVFIACGGVTALIRNLGTVGMARMAESMLGALLFLLNKPDTRARARIDLECLAAPYTDPHTLGGGAAGGPKKGTDVGWTDTECRLQWAHVVLVSLLRSWPGLLHFCHTEKEGLRSIVATLYLNQHEVRRAVLDLFYEVLCIPQPEWSDEPQVALDAVDPSRYQDAFRIGEGFVAAEGRAVLPHCSKSRVNLQEVHLSLLLYSFLEAGLLDAIVEVIVSDDSFLSVRATILLGELLHLIHLLLPPECCHVTPVLPSLVSYAVRGRRSAANLQHFNTASAHYQRFRQQMMVLNSRLLKKEEKVGNTASATATNSKRERKRTVSSQSCRSRTVSDSSGDRSRLDRDSLSAQADPAANGSYSSAEPKTTSKTASILRDIQDVLKDNTENQSSTTSLDEIGNDKQPYDDKQYLGPGHTSDLCAGDFYVAGHQPLPEFYERGGIFEEEVDDPKLTPSYPIDEPFSVRAQQRAMTAVSTLARLHRLLRKRPAPASIFLDHLITSIDKKQVPSSGDLARAKGKVLSKSKLSQLLNKECEEAIKDSGVLIVKDPFSWNWDTIRSILKGRSECFYEANHRQFLKKLVQFFMPNSRQLMRIDVGGDRRVANIYTMTALELLDCLILSPKESECEKMLYELLGSISTEISQVNTSPHNCLLSPQNVIGTLCADYFLYVGHLSRSETGRSLLEKTGVFQKLYDLISATNLDCYVKLVVSTLDYTEVGFARRIMNVALKSEVVSFRLYATKLLHVLLRTPMQDCQSMIDWVVVSLIDRVGDTDRAIRNVALEALDEACDCVEYLKSIIKMRPNHLEQHSDAGLLICVRLVSTPEGFIQMLEDGFVRRQLQYWGDDYNWRYVCVVEAKLCDSLTLHERNEDGTYCARVSGVKRTPGNVFVPPHLYGQLAQHEAGFKMLMADEHVKKCVSTVLLSSCRTDSEIHQLKAALWALGHITSSPAGARWAREQRVTAAILAAVRASAVYSVRGTALYALSMMASTEEGACALRQAGWHTTRHHRHERWPVLVALDLLEDVVVINDDEMDVSQDSSSGGGGDCSLGDPVGRGHFYLPLDLDSEDGQLMSDDAMGDHHQQQRQRRAATLPAQLGRGGASGGPSKQLVPPGGGYQHIRSYSESKADSSEMASPARMVGSQLSADSMDSRANLSIDGLRKNRPSSWDISSGSSTDSVQQYSKYNVGDRIQTLSPIPSSGSLTTIKYPAVANPQSRRTSVTNSISSHKSTRLSHQDAVGYATLRFLHRGRRPMMASGGPLPSFSPLSPIEQLAFADLRRQISPLVRPRRHYMAERNAASEFDGQGVACHSMLSDVTGATLPYQSSRSCIARGSDTNSAAESAWSGACYLGICLPHRLAELFPSDDLRHQKPPYAREITDSIQDTGLENNSSGDSETDTGTDSGGGGVPLGGGGATLGAFGGYSVANSSGSSKQRRRHDRQNCLLCTSNRVANQRVSRLRKISSSSTHRTRTETESSYGAGGEGESPIMLPWQTRGGLEGVNSVDSSSTDAASIVHRSPMDNMRSRSMVRRDILKLACQLSNPVLYKTCKQALLQLKQLYNDLFQDICVYSDVCSIIANSMHRIQARRFLQELFLDIPFTELYEDAVTLLSGGENGMDDYDQLMQGGGGGDQLICQQLQMAATTLADESNSSMSASDATAGATGGGNNFRSAKSGAKSAFNDEQRSNPLLEVIPEHDARSDSSDACCRDSLSQSMLNLSDFSAPNSFDANDGVLDAASFEQRNFNHNTTSLILGEPHSDTRPLSTSSHNTKPMIYQMHSDSLLRTSTSLPSSSSSTSRPRPTSRRRSLSKEKETEKAKQMIEQSSSKISVLQEALKQTSPSSAYQSKGFEESTNQSKGSRVIELEVVLGVSNSKQNVDPSLSNIEHHGRFCIELVDPGSSDLKVDQSSTSVEHQVALGSSLKGQVVDEGLSSLKHKTDLGLSDVNKDVDLSLSDLKDDKSSASVKHQVDQASSSLKHQSDLALSDVDQSTFKDVDPSSSDLKVDKSSTSVKHQVHQGSSSLKHHSDLGSTDGFSMEKVDDLVESALSKSCSSNVDEASNLQLSSKDVSKTDEKSSVLNQQSSKDSKNFSKFESELAVEHCNPVLESSCVPVMKNITETENVTSNLTFYNVGQQLDLKYPLLDTNEVKPKLSSCSEMENSFFKPCSSSLKVESSFPKTDRSSLKSDSTTLKSENSSLNSDSTTLKSECSYLTSDSSSKFDSTCSKSQSISSKPEASHSKTDSSTLKSDSASLKTDSNPLKQEKSPLKPESSEITSLKTESSSLKTESSSLKTDSNPSKLDKSPLKPESSAAKIEIASMKTESSSSKTDTDINPSKLDKSPLKSETKTESFLLKSDSTSLKTDSTSLKTDSTFSKTSKEISCPTSKPSNRSRRLKSQSHVGPSLLSSSPSSSSSSKSGNTASKITSKHSDDVTGPGSEQTKLTTAKLAHKQSDNTAGQGSEQTKPTTAKSQRQRKKATTKEPIRESLEVGKK